MSQANRMRQLRCREFTLPLDRTLLMGVLNVTPDSFSDGGRFLDPGEAVRHAQRMVDEGADLIDAGAESSRPGSDPVPAEEEWRRLRPVLEGLLRDVRIPISVDTYKPEVAGRALALGAHMLNDIAGLRDPAMIETVASHGAAAVIMHMKGEPKTMQQAAEYEDVVAEVKAFLERQAARASAAGIDGIVIDPGLGFGKTAQHSLEILRRLPELVGLGYPVLIGPSRKSFLGQVTGAPVEDRLEGTLAAVTAAVLGGARIVRVHDVKQCRRAVQVAEAIRGA
jgi:dihydropteroate synthase